ncbi:hypothetical protein IV72_GL000344 [Atopobium minutum]|nr:hypothetical protein IV72_GL000344 [Atopobium minutum]
MRSLARRTSSAAIDPPSPVRLRRTTCRGHPGEAADPLPRIPRRAGLPARARSRRAARRSARPRSRGRAACAFAPPFFQSRTSTSLIAPLHAHERVPGRTMRGGGAFVAEALEKRCEQADHVKHLGLHFVAFPQAQKLEIDHLHALFHAFLHAAAGHHGHLLAQKPRHDVVLLGQAAHGHYRVQPPALFGRHAECYRLAAQAPVLVQVLPTHRLSPPSRPSSGCTRRWLRAVCSDRPPFPAACSGTGARSAWSPPCSRAPCGRRWPAPSSRAR